MTHPTDALRLVPVPFNLLSEAAGLLDCEGYGPISSQLNALFAGSGLLSRGDLHTALLDAIHGDLMRQNPGAFTEEDGNSTLAIPTSKAFLTVDVSSLAEAALAAAPASPLPEGGGDEALIAELKEARELITDIAASKITEDNPYIWKWASEVIIKARAFLVRNGKGEEPHTPRNAPRGLSDEC